MSVRNWALAIALGISLAPWPAMASVVVDATVTPVGGGVFHYEISVTNTEIAELALVSIVDAPLSDPLIDPSLEAPIGFLANYDGGLGIIDLLADSGTFASGSTITGFSFDSLSSPQSSFAHFEALTVLGDSVVGDVNFLSAVPEPTTLALLGLGLAGLATSSRRRKN